MDNNYNKFLKSNGITHKADIKRREFDNKVWNKLPSNVQLDRMINLTTSLIIIDDDWANAEMLKRRKSRNFIRPRGKTDKVW